MELLSIFNLDDNVFTWCNIMQQCTITNYHSPMREVHLVDGHVVYVYWIDTVYVQNNLPNEFSKGTSFII